jgi:hypothetical protein
MSKLKPLLHRVRGVRDPELYQPDLDWYFGSFDSLCGVKSVSDMGYLLELSAGNGVKAKHIEDPNDEHPDDRRQVTFVAKASVAPVFHDNRQENLLIDSLDSIRRARRIWHRLRLLPWPTQQALARIYEARREPLDVKEHELRSLHRQYMEIL